MDQEKNENKKMIALAIGLVGQVTGWIAAPLLLGLFAGNWLDNKYQTGDK